MIDPGTLESALFFLCNKCIPLFPLLSSSYTMRKLCGESLMFFVIVVVVANCQSLCMWAYWIIFRFTFANIDLLAYGSDIILSNLAFVLFEWQLWLPRCYQNTHQTKPMRAVRLYTKISKSENGPGHGPVSGGRGNRHPGQAVSEGRVSEATEIKMLCRTHQNPPSWLVEESSLKTDSSIKIKELENTCLTSNEDLHSNPSAHIKSRAW